MNGKTHTQILGTALAEKETCIWRCLEGSIFEPECKPSLAYWFEDGTPSENGFRFCPYCGRTLAENQENH